MSRILLVVDMQNDFIDGALGSEAAEKIVDGVAERINNFDGRVIFTRDTHLQDYLTTQEGKKLPVSHCIKDSWGWQITDELLPFVETVLDKITFGSVDLPKLIKDYGEDIDEIELLGLCTDICVISNAMILKASFPEVKIVVNGKLSAGVTKESHQNALNAMKAVQIEVIE